MKKMNNRFKNLLNSENVAYPNITKEEESQYNPNEPRNILANTINPLLDEYVNPYIEKLPLSELGINENIRVPELSVADRKRFVNELTPENMVLNMGMGKIKNTNLIDEVLGRVTPKIKLKSNDKEVAKKIAKEFDELVDDPTNPEVVKAYDAMMKDVLDQYDKFNKAGFKFEKITGENPYNTSKDMLEDVFQNKTLKYYPTERGFGSGTNTQSPMLKGSGRHLNGEELVNNDVFRIVHDLVGHGANRSGFGPVGEEIAYQTHKATMSPLAQKALATETRGQNSWVNFGPNGEFNRANPSKTIYADQKANIMSDSAINSAYHTVEKQVPTLEKLFGIANPFTTEDEEDGKQ